MGRINVSTSTFAKTPGQMVLGRAAGSDAVSGTRRATIRVTMSLRPGAPPGTVATVWITESGKWRKVGTRNLATGTAAIDIATDLNKNPRVSVVSSLLTGGGDQLEFGSLPPGVSLARRPLRVPGREAGPMIRPREIPPRRLSGGLFRRR